MTSTTLMTFLLRTPSNVRSVELLGSWDNFSRPYPMEQDRRIGAGHWRGCHTFTDIICDGTTQSQSPARTGGLKMGGTYWYYYRLDGDIEYYNDAEPVTTLCPLLPGQPVNVLNVPIILPDTNVIHQRDASVSSLKSDHRTMDPKDKYMNPRTPPRPKLPRLKTSPPLYQQPNSSWSSFINWTISANQDRSVSQPTSSTSSPRFRLAPKFKVARSASPPGSRGLRDALSSLTRARSSSLDPDERHRGRCVGPQNVGDIGLSHSSSHQDSSWLHVPASNPSSEYASRVASPAETPNDGPGIGRLPYRRAVFDGEDGHQRPSLRNRRASKCSSRDMSPFASYLRLDSSSEEGSFSGISNISRNKRLETLEEALSQQNTPMAVVTSKPRSADMITPTPFEKRLPTLPSSPSSIMDEELRALDAQDRALDMKYLNSHFSDCTSASGSEADADSPLEKSRFSEWSTDAELVSPVSMTSCSTFNNNDQPRRSSSDDVVMQFAAAKYGFPTSSSGPVTPTLSTVPQVLPPTTVASDSPVVSTSAASSEAMRFAGGDLGIPALCIEDFDEDLENNPKRHAGLFPRLETLAPLSICRDDKPAPGELRSRHSDDLSDSADAVGSGDTGANVSFLSQSAAMRELMDELGYLGDMIQVGL